MFSDEDSDGTYGRKPSNGKKSSRRAGYDEYSEDEDFSRSKRDSRERRGDSAKAKDRRGGDARSSRREPIKAVELNMARLSRGDLAEFKHRKFFEDMLKGALLATVLRCKADRSSGSYVKCPAGRDEKGQTKYRCYLVLGEPSCLGCSLCRLTRNILDRTDARGKHVRHRISRQISSRE